jgi:polysaccharide export outer membrane protein
MKKRVVVGLLAVLAAACSPPVRTQSVTTSQTTGVADPTHGGVSDEQNQAHIQRLAAERAKGGDKGGYRIGPDDLLEVRIPDLIDTPTEAIVSRTTGGLVPSMAPSPTFAQGLRVSASGDVTIPHLGEVRADGLTPTELEQDVGRRLVERGILRSPQVTVTVVEYRSRTVAVVGAVERPGVFPVTRPGATVSDLIWAAGGPTKDSGRVVQLVPVAGPPGAMGTPVRLDLDTLLNASAGNEYAIPVRAGDVISLGPAGNIQVQGWVDKPGSYPVSRGMRLSGAVAAAGGPLFPADKKHTEVLRVLGTGEPQHFVVDLDAVAQGHASDVVMLDGDVVRMPASTALLVPWSIWNIAATMIRIGGNVLLF